MAIATEILEPPAREIMIRGRKTLETVLARSGGTALKPLQTATNEISFLMQAARLAIDALGISADADKELNQARLRGLSRIVELRKLAEPCLKTGEVCELLGLTRETIRKKVDRNQLLALPKGGDRVFPAFQFDQGDVVRGFSDVLRALDTASPFVALSFFLSRSRDFGNKTVIEALQDGKIEEVLAKAGAFLKDGS